MTRQEQIDKGKLWQVYLKANDQIVFECRSETAALNFIKEKDGSLRLWKRGKSDYSFGKVIWEENEDICN